MAGPLHWTRRVLQILLLRTSCRAWLCALVVGVAGMAMPGPASAQTAASAEVKAAYLFNFSKFVAWPRDATSEGKFVLGVMGDGPVADALRDMVRGKSIAGRALVVKRVTLKDDLTQLQILFVNASEAARLGELIKRLGGASVLTVSDLDRFCEVGGMIQFRLDDDRVRFDINLDQAEARGLQVNSKLLALAKSVHSTKSR